MGKGIIRAEIKRLEEVTGFTFDYEHFSPDKIKSNLLLPDNYTVEACLDRCRGIVSIQVSSPDIPDASEGETLPSINPCYLRNEKGEVTLTKVLIDPLAHSVGEKPEILLADRMLRELNLELGKKIKEGNWHGND